MSSRSAADLGRRWRVSETAWAGSGGGISADWECSPGLATGFPVLQRSYPDVAFNADPNSGTSGLESRASGRHQSLLLRRVGSRSAERASRLRNGRASWLSSAKLARLRNFSPDRSGSSTRSSTASSDFVSAASDVQRRHFRQQRLLGRSGWDAVAEAGEHAGGIFPASTPIVVRQMKGCDFEALTS